MPGEVKTMSDGRTGNELTLARCSLLWLDRTGTEIQGFEQKSYRHEETTSTRHAKGAGLD